VPRPSVLHVVSELYPFVKTGGLADVAAGLPAALRDASVDARVIVPGYPAVLDAIQKADSVWHSEDLLGGGAARVLAGTLAGNGVPAYVVDCPGLYRRKGGPYQDESGVDFPDNARRFAALGWAAAELALSSDEKLSVDVLHAHDWQAGLAIAYAKLRGDRGDRDNRGPACVATIHSIAYPGGFDRGVLSELALPPGSYSIHGVEFFGSVSFLKAALYYADRITTVSPTYAREIQEDGLGGGFEGLLRARSANVSGILNGVDYREWDPSTGLHIPRRYDAKDLRGKAFAKEALERRLGFPVNPRAPLYGVVSRLVWQKGIDWVVEVLPWLISRGARLAVLGTGDASIATALRVLARRHPDHVAVTLGYDEALSHLMQAGCDGILVPSRTEPCGLTQLYALRYGSPPVVRRTGGLTDTVVDATATARKSRTATGFSFDVPTADGLKGALGRALELYEDTAEFRRIQRAGMRADFGWGAPARRYVELYEAMIRLRP
jgi:starch synthase